MNLPKPPLSIVCVLVFLSLLTSPACQKNKYSETVSKSAQVEGIIAGSGYRDLEGTFMQYEYQDFGAFRLAFTENKLKWKGYGGYFDGVIAEVEPRISKIEEDVYFLSWVFDNGGGDNVVVNLGEERVFAHLYHSNPKLSNDFELIHGQVLCSRSADCQSPDGDLMGLFKTILKLKSNIKKYDLPSLGTMSRPPIQANRDVQDAFANKILRYNREGEIIEIQISADSTRVSRGAVFEEHRNYATKISDGVFFISWLEDESSAKHIVFNANMMKVFEHTVIDNVRREMIYDVVCFDSPENC